MDQYGYELNHLANRVRRFSARPPTIANAQDKTTFYVLIGCIVLFIVLVARR